MISTSINRIQKHQLTKILPDVLVLFCCILSVAFSTIESKLSTDAHHWGLMYTNAAYLHKGLIPYREIFIQYGWLTTLIQSLSLNIFGNTVASVGIITGIFYAANIYLSYCLWQRVMNRWLSALSSILMFLVSGYIAYPWANYFSYTFFLISLLFLITHSQKAKTYLLSGFFLGLSILARQSPIPLLAPIYLYFVLMYFSSDQKLPRLYLKNILTFHIGMIGIVAVFLLYIAKESAFEDWVKQSFTIGMYYKEIFNLEPQRVLPNFAKRIFYPKPNSRSVLYSIVYLNALIIYGIFFLKCLGKLIKLRKIQFDERDKLLFLFSSVTLFGYLQALHLYNMFRLQSASSLGLGLVVLSLYQLSGKFKRWKMVVFTVPLMIFFILLSNTLLFAKTPVTFVPWDRDLLFSHQLKEPRNIAMLEGKLYDEETRTYYETLVQTLSSYQCKLEYLVNFTQDGYIPSLSESFKRVQRSPLYDQQLARVIFQDEQRKIAQLLKEGKTILIAAQVEEIPENYQIAHEIKTPASTQHWSFNGRSLIGKVTYIAVPKSVSSSCLGS
jgi:hypothetical protein